MTTVNQRSIMARNGCIIQAAFFRPDGETKAVALIYPHNHRPSVIGGTMKYSGSCSCGAVKYETSAEPVLQGNCHCHKCQRMTGSGYSATLFFPTNAVNISGEVRNHSHTGSNGKEVGRGFCPKCGSQLFGYSASMPNLLGIRAGTLNDTSMYKPAVNICTSSAAIWNHMDPSLPNFPEMPPMP